MSQSHDLHRALLRPSIIHILRAAGFHSTRPSVLDTLTNIAERYLLLLATTTARHAANSHNDAGMEEEDLADVRVFEEWFDGAQHAEMRRVAGMVPDAGAAGTAPAVGVGGGVVVAEDFLVVVEGGPVQRVRDWRPRLEERSVNSLGPEREGKMNVEEGVTEDATRSEVHDEGALLVAEQVEAT
ncbi:hypothetical protein BAUCODRAFT_235095 [Baudoinia panamericana UAMH 10762]|uniref:Bromodomain associated domain-containing protein n=1 Tax=Baudoinia panamericana (strain UAMH 10762) TaxID=717646 RepID=M2MP85_BAUPA|nr:uncharacterized protein BAUCODRAFT_235095 [Baudoinia panamericana UAMH 10762]EMC93283.1 hypothetical protein BAUCODRAFT_235095 [Baudoinia panamericana UAMH 10762]